MIRKRSEMQTEVRENMRGGTGKISITHLIPGDQLAHGRLLAEIAVPPGGEIGEHQHSGETEYFIIVEGRGIIRDNGTDTKVEAGDVVATGTGSSHNVSNPGDTTLKMIAVIMSD